MRCRHGVRRAPNRHCLEAASCSKSVPASRCPIQHKEVSLDSANITSRWVDLN